MELTRIGREDDAVSEVIGVILMVAITVILASVVAFVVLGVGEETETTPTAKFTFEYDASGNELEITHDSGETVRASNLFIRGDAGGGSSNMGADWSDSNWKTPGTTSASLGGDPAVASGDSMRLDAGSDYDIRVVWQASDGSTSATLSKDTGPDA